MVYLGSGHGHTLRGAMPAQRFTCQYMRPQLSPCCAIQGKRAPVVALLVFERALFTRVGFEHGQSLQ